MRKILLYSSALVAGGLLSGVAEAACIQTPSCSSLGYTSSSSCSGGTKCPFGNYWNCTGPNNANKITELTNKITILETKVNELSKDTETENCKIGDILYSDMSCNANMVASKTPIGVIFDTTNRLVLSLKWGYQLNWSTLDFDIPNLTNYSTPATSDWKGKENTKTIVDYCDANKYTCQAAKYAASYTTTGTKVGDWYLPAAGELFEIYSHKDILNSSLKKIGANEFDINMYFWSSTEGSEYKAWVQNFNDDSDGYMTNKEYKDWVCPIMQY